MSLGCLALGLMAWALGLLFLFTLLKTSGDQDRAARHEERRLYPYSDVPITQFGQG